MGNKTGKGARNGQGGKEKHAVKGDKVLDGDCSRSEGVHTGTAELVKSKENEMSFSAGTEKKNDYKAVTTVVKAGGKSVRINGRSTPPKQTPLEDDQASCAEAEQKDNLGIGSSNGIKPGLTNQNAPVNGSLEDQSDSVDFPHKSEAFPSEDHTDSPHSSSSEVAIKSSTNSGHANNFMHSTNHEDSLADDQNEVSTSASLMGRVPTTGDVSNNLEERTSQKPIDKEQTYDSGALNQSILPSSQSKIESSTPTTTQFVQGRGGKVDLDKEVVKLDVGGHLVSKAVTENVLLLDKLSKYLDKESRVIKFWKHLAYVLEVPPEETQKFDIYTEHSPTEDLLNFLEGNTRDLCVGDLKKQLQAVYRNDVVEDLQKAGFNDDSLLRVLVPENSKFVALLSSKLDMESRTIGNWKSLANQFGIKKQTSDQFGLHGSGPTEALFLHIRTDEKLRHLTMGQLLKHFREMERNDLVGLLKKFHFVENDSRLVRNEAVDGSEVLAGIGERLNKESRAVKNWRNLAYRLKIPHEVYGAFDTSKAKAKSSTKEMFKWLAKQRPNLTVDDLLAALKKIDRFDVVDLVREETNFAKKTLVNLQELHRDADKHQKQGGLLPDLRMIASGKGFEVVDNDGKGNCMFHALCHQLKYKKHLEISHQDLRNELVKYLHEHSKMADGTELAVFIDRFASWTEYLHDMAQDGKWGDHVILFAAANCYKCDIHVISSVPSHDCTVRPDPPISDAAQLVLGHVVEVHYVSLKRSVSDRDGQLQQPPSNIPQLGIYGQHKPEINGKKDSDVDRKDFAVKDIPYGVYSKICTKLNIRRDFFDDFRMVAEKLGMNRDAIEFIGQGRNPTDKIFTSGDRRVTVRRFIAILHEIERSDVAEVLEEWVAKS